MAYDSIIQQGRFTSDGTAKTLKIRSDVDRIVIENSTQRAATNNGYAYGFVWNRGMGTEMYMDYHPAGDHTAAVDVKAAAISLIDSSNYALGGAISVTAGSNITKPLYSTGDTSGLTDGAIVRLSSTDHNNINGLDFTIDNLIANTSFELANTLATAPGRVAGNAGKYRLVAPNLEVYRLFTPSHRNIADISQAASGVVTTLVDHGYAIGQRVKFALPGEYGMIELNDLTGNITAITASTFTIDVDTTAFTAFEFPVYGEVPFRLATVTIVGDNPLYAGNQLAPGSLYNQGYIGVVLNGGATFPAGSNNDVIYWTAYKSVRVDNE